MSYNKCETITPTHYIIGGDGKKYFCLVEDGVVFRKVGETWMYISSIEDYFYLCLEYHSLYLRKLGE